MSKSIAVAAARDLFTPFGGAGLSFAVLGPPKTGKSDFAGSCAALGRTLVLAAKPREANSRLYIANGADREVFFDANWAPSIGKYDADAYVRLLRRLHDLQSDDTYDFIVVDAFTDIVELAAAELLKVERAATPRDMSDSQGFYGSLYYKLREVTKLLGYLQFAKKPKHVIVIAHVQPAKEDSRDPGKKTADKRAQGVEYEGSVLPMIEGKYRYKFAGDLDMVFFSDVEITQEMVREGAKTSMRPVTRYVLQAQPNLERHAGGVLSALLERTIPNDFAEVLSAVERARSSAVEVKGDG